MRISRLDDVLRRMLLLGGGGGIKSSTSGVRDRRGFMSVKEEEEDCRGPLVCWPVRFESGTWRGVEMVIGGVECACMTSLSFLV